MEGWGGSRTAVVGFVAAAAAGAIATLAVPLWASEQVLTSGARAQAALETLTALAAITAAYLLHGRVRHGARGDDALLVTALVLLAASTLAYGAIPVAAGVSPAWIVWAGSTANLITGAVFAAAATASPLRRPWVRTVPSVAALTLCALAALIGLGIAGLGVELPPEIRSEAAPSVAAAPAFFASLQVAACVLFAVAALGFLRRATREEDALLAWLAVGTLFAAFARINGVVLSSRFTDALSLTDLFRALASLTLLAGVGWEIRRYWQGVAEAAALEERRRMARDLHDTVAQELSYIVRAARGAATDATMTRIESSARRGLEESRRAIAALSRPVGSPFEDELAAVARDVADRHSVELDLDLAPGVEAGPTLREALLRIAGEATRNAAVHAHPSRIRVELRGEPAPVLRVIDDGAGFDPEGASDGFGLVGMRERAESVGARMSVDSEPGHGTVVEVRLP